MTNKKCPKCGSRNFQISDYVIMGFIYEVEDGEVTGEGMDEGGKRVSTICRCRNCDHSWHPRNFEFIVDK